MYLSRRHGYARGFCDDVLFIAYGIFHTRIKIGDVQRITPYEAQDFLKIVRMGFVEAYGFGETMIAHADGSLEFSVVGNERRSGVVVDFAVKIRGDDVFPILRILSFDLILRRSSDAEQCNYTNSASRNQQSFQEPVDNFLLLFASL